MKSVAIIGGGITGLVAALSLRKAGFAPTVYEASQRVGGPMQTIERDGYLAECGPNTLLETSPRIREIIREAGLEDALLYSDPDCEKRFLVRGGRMIAMPSTIPGFIGTKLFSLRAKLRLLREPFIPPAPVDKEETVEGFVLRRLGREFLDYAIDPLVGGIYAGDPARLSVPHAFPKLRALELRYGSLLRGQFLGSRERKHRAEVSKSMAKKISFPHGLGSLPSAIQHTLGDMVQLNSPVVAVERSGNDWQVTINQPDGTTRIESHDAVLFAAPANRIARIKLTAGRDIDLNVLGGIQYPPIASVVLGFRRDDVAHPLDGFGALIPKVEGFSILGALFSSSLFPGRAPAGHVTISCYIGGMRAPELARRSGPELVEMVVRDLRRLVGVRGPVTFENITIFPHAIPQYEAGFGRFKKHMESVERDAPGVFLAGHFRDGISLSDSMMAGSAAAERIGRYLQQSTHSPVCRTAEPIAS